MSRDIPLSSRVSIDALLVILPQRLTYDKFLNFARTIEIIKRVSFHTSPHAKDVPGLGYRFYKEYLGRTFVAR